MMNPRNHYLPALFLRWAPLLFWMGVIFLFSADSNPYRVLPSNWESACLTLRLGSFCQDEILGRISHVSEYTVLALLLCRAVFWKRGLVFSGVLLAAGMACGYALLDEVHQLFVPGRTFQVFDLGLDVSGILLGLLLYALPRMRRAKSPGTA